MDEPKENGQDVTEINGLWRVVFFDADGVLVGPGDEYFHNDNGDEIMFAVGKSPVERTYTLDNGQVGFGQEDGSTETVDYELVDGGIVYRDASGAFCFDAPFFDGFYLVLKTENGVTTQSDRYTFIKDSTTERYGYGKTTPSSAETFSFDANACTVTSSTTTWSMAFTDSGYTLTDDSLGVTYEEVRFFNGTWLLKTNPSEYMTIADSGYQYHAADGSNQYGYIWSPDARNVVFQNTVEGATNSYELTIVDANNIVLTDSSGSYAYERNRTFELM